MNNVKAPADYQGAISALLHGGYVFGLVYLFLEFGEGCTFVAL
jgi:hypothetical protein